LDLDGSVFNKVLGFVYKYNVIETRLQ